MSQTSYGKHMEYLLRQPDEILAEIQGFKDARFHEVPVLRSDNEKLWKRYEQGFLNGKTLLALEEEPS